MKKILFASALFSVLNFAMADTINAPSGLIGKNGLNGNYAYLWSVPLAAQTAQDITSATITFTGVVLKGGKGKDISVDFGNFLTPTAGVLSSIKDKSAAGDAFNANVVAQNAVHLGTQMFVSKKVPTTFSYTLNAAQLDALNSYIAAGNWGFEIDPDSKFSVGGITFSYTSEITPKPTGVVVTAPDAMTTFGLLGASFLGLITIRRRLCFN